MLLNYLNKYTYSITFICSLAISFLAIYNTLPNNDGILYIKTAEVFLSDGLKASLAVYHWPLLSILIAFVSKALAISTLNAAYLITSILQGLLVICFLGLFKKLNPTNTQLLLAVITILIFPQINEYRHYILRDWGFWAFSLLAITSLCNYCEGAITSNKYFNSNNFKYTIYYYCSFIAAFLFRGEAFIIMLLLPLGILFLHYPNQPVNFKYKKLLAIYQPLLLAIGIVFTLTVLVITLLINNISLSDLGYSLYINLHFNKLAIILDTYTHSIRALNEQIFTLTPLDNFTAIVYFLTGATAVFIAKYISVINIINVVLLIITYQLYKNNKIKSLNQGTPQSNTLRLILFSIFILSLLPLGFLYLIFVTAGRYYILSSILMLLFIPFGLDYYWHKLKQSNFYNNHTGITNTALSLVIITITCSGIISSGYSKEYIKHAGLWFKQQNFTTQQAYSNNSQLNFYSGLRNDLLIVEDDKKIPANSNNISYLLLKVKNKQIDLQDNIKVLEKNNTITVLNKFGNKRGDTVMIIKYKS